MKILFLDVDGVLNSEWSTLSYWYRLGRVGVHCDVDTLCPLACASLRLIMESCPDTNIVVSSTWRLFDSLEWLQKMLLDQCGIPPARVIDITPALRGERGHEIQKWLDDNTKHEVLMPKYQVDDFVIVDDDSDMAHLMDKLVQTDSRLGLTIIKAREIIEKLGGKENWHES